MVINTAFCSNCAKSAAWEQNDNDTGHVLVDRCFRLCPDDVKELPATHLVWESLDYYKYT